MLFLTQFSFFFFFNDTATTEIYTLSLHDALPISPTELIGSSSTFFATLVIAVTLCPSSTRRCSPVAVVTTSCSWTIAARSEEHTSELQSPCNLVCRLLLEKKKNTQYKSVLCVMMR